MQPLPQPLRRRVPFPRHQPASRPEALRQREDLAIVWLHQDSPSGPISQHRHCATCQPHIECDTVECAHCGDGPILTGALVDQLRKHDPNQPTALRAWLTSHGWQLEPEPIAWAREQTRTPEHLLALVVLVKSCHRLEYFPVLAEVPPPVTEHIRGVLELKPDVQARHDSDRTLRQHKSLVRDGYDLVLVAELMGHARTETTRGYSLPTADDAQAAINSLPADR
jgi:hypothetical protein